MPTHTSQPSAGRARWSSERAFVLAAAGSAVGLGNLWEFPRLAGDYGGGAFVLVYVAAVAAVSVPLLAAELAIGRRARRNPVDAMAVLARRERRSRLWDLPGWLGVAASLLMLAVYSVVAAWAVAYLWDAVSGGLASPGGSPGRRFPALLASPASTTGWQLGFVAAGGLIAAAGVRRGVERAAQWLVPGLVLTLAALLVLAAARGGGLGRAASYLFLPDFALLDGRAVLAAVRHACFTLSLGLAVMTTYGSYLPDSACIPRAAVAVALGDTVVSLLGGLAILAFVFAAGLQPADGPSLAFMVVPAALAEVRGGAVVATLFFLLLLLAALTSAIALLEPAIALAEERLRLPRAAAAAAAAALAGIAGVILVLAFDRWAGIRLGGEGLFALVNRLLSTLLLPLAAAGTALFAGHVLSRRAGREELGLCGGTYRLWWLMVRWAAPAGVGLAVLGLQS